MRAISLASRTIQQRAVYMSPLRHWKWKRERPHLALYRTCRTCTPVSETQRENTPLDHRREAVSAMSACAAVRTCGTCASALWPLCAACHTCAGPQRPISAASGAHPWRTPSPSPNSTITRLIITIIIVIAIVMSMRIVTNRMVISMRFISILFGRTESAPPCGTPGAPCPRARRPW